MIVIGERLNGMFKDVGKAIVEQDKAVIQDLAKRQLEAGANVLDLNVGPTAEDAVGAMKWLVETTREVTDAPLAIDSTKLAVIRAGVELGGPTSMINSSPGDEAKLDTYMPLAAEFDCDIVCLTIDEKGIPRDANGRMEIAMRIVEKAMLNGVDLQRIYIDPVIIPCNVPDAGHHPGEVLETLMSPPCFPVSFLTLGDRVQGRGIPEMASQVLLVHAEAGWEWMPLDRYSRCESTGLVAIGGREVPLDRCLRVRTMQTSHPEYTISYRFEEGPTGRVAVLLTDHEASNKVPEDLLAHLCGAHLLLQDAQYTRQAWQDRFIGYGHGTGDFAARVLFSSRVGRLGLTHHDPEADDDDVDRILREAAETLRDLGGPELQGRLFSVHDLQEVEV